MTTTAAIALLVFGLVIVLYGAFLHSKLPSPHNPYNSYHHGNNNNNNDHVANSDASRINIPNLRYRNPYAAIIKERSHRLAIVIPYLPSNDGAPTFPAYFDLFITSAAGSANVADYLIFHCFVPREFLPKDEMLPRNVILIDMNIYNTDTTAAAGTTEGKNSKGCGLAQLFTRVTDIRQEQNSMQTISLEQLIHRLSTQIINLPYILVEYKPAFGHIFATYLTNYTHWGYSDLDVIFGDLSRWIDDDEWTDYDIVTYSYGDQDKLYLRGQFTFHRNDPLLINQLWRHCKYLSEMDIRYSHPETLSFESAEGCYSQAILVRSDIKVKWAVKATTDYLDASPIYTQGVYLSLGSSSNHLTSSSLLSSVSGVHDRPRSVLYTSSTLSSGDALLTVPYNWFEDKINYPKYIESTLPIQKHVGERTIVETYRTRYNNTNNNMNENEKEKAKHNVKCMFWAPQTYQSDICTIEGSVHSDETVILEKGILYKQKFIIRQHQLFPEGIISFPFFHYQEWKRTYRSTELLVASNIRNTNIMSGLIVTKEGILPLFASTQSSSSSSWTNKFRHPTISTTAWMLADTGSTVLRTTSNKFCLFSLPKAHLKGATVCKIQSSWPRLLPSSSSMSSSSNNALSLNSNKVVIPHDSTSASVTILRSPAGQTTMLKASITNTMRGTARQSTTWWDTKLVDANKDVTLVLTLQISNAHMTAEESVIHNLLSLVDTNIYLWGSKQPSVLLIHVDTTTIHDGSVVTRTLDMINDMFAIPPSSDEEGSSSSSSTTMASLRHLRNTLVAIVTTKDYPNISRKALMNMATYIAPTRYIVSGLEVERGLLLSNEASVYASRMARVYTDMPGHVFVIPQFASKNDIDDILFPADIESMKKSSSSSHPDRMMYTSVGASLLPSMRGKKTLVSNLSTYDCMKCTGEDNDGDNSQEKEEEDGGEIQGEDGEESLDDTQEGAGEDNDDVSSSAAATNTDQSRRRLTSNTQLASEVNKSTGGKTVDDLLDELWWDLSVADAFGTPGGFSGEARLSSIMTMAEIHDSIEVSLMSLLDVKDETQLNYLHYYDKSPILMIDRLGPKKEMMTLDLVPEVEDFRGRRCFHLLRLAQLAAYGYKIRVLSGAFTASYPKTRDALCSESMRQSVEPMQQTCDCELDSKGTLKEILIDETKRSAKVAVLMNEHDVAVVQ
jgi:hypothetical protein